MRSQGRGDSGGEGGMVRGCLRIEEKRHLERPGEGLKGPPRDQCKDPQGAMKDQSRCDMGLENGGVGGTRSPCQAFVKPGKEQLGFSVSPSGVLVAGPEWTPGPWTAVPSAHGSESAHRCPGEWTTQRGRRLRCSAAAPGSLLPPRPCRT